MSDSSEAHDGIILPFALLTIATYFYPADLAERRRASHSITMIALTSGLIISWLWRRSHRGRLLASLHYPRQVMLFWSCVAGLFLIIATWRLFHPTMSSGGIATRILCWMSSCGFWIAWHLFFASAAFEMRQKGCVSFLQSFDWTAIQSYEWNGPAADVLVLHYTLHDQLLSTAGREPVAR